jgi:integrase
VRDYLEAAKVNGLSTATLKQHMAAVRMLFDHLVTGGVLEHNPALSVKAPRQKLGKGKTPVLTAEEAGELLRSIEPDSVLALRDRALIGVMVFTFARISAACGLNVTDNFHQQRRLWVRLHEKGGKFHKMPCHHTLDGYLAEYVERAGLAEAGRAPLFQAIKVRTYGRGEAVLNGERLHRTNAWWCAGAPGRPASPRRYATTPSVAPASPPTWRTRAHWRRRVRWRPMPPPARHSSTTGARTASR